MEIAGIGRLNGPNHLDHILPLCDLLGGAFLSSEEDQLELAEKYYPKIPLQFVDARMLHTEYVKEHYDILIHSFSWPKELIDHELTGKEKKKRKLRCIHTPHGNSDKGYYTGILRNYALQDICLLYGEHMIDMLKHLDVFSSLKNYVLIGNLRYQYYLKYQSFFDDKAKEEVFSRLDPHKKTILYAPTWDDLEKSSSLYDVYPFVLEKLPQKYNVIVKLHPWLKEFSPSVGKLYHILGKYEDKPNILFLTDYPVIYPLLAKTDIYLGDFSSIGYDFLTFNRPMFFFNPMTDIPSERSLFLHQCGTTIPYTSGEEILEKIEEGLQKDECFERKRKEIYRYAFGELKDPAALKEEIISKAALPW